MRLFVRDKNSNNKIYLNILAPTRRDLANTIGSSWFLLHGYQYHVHEVSAESEENNTGTGALVGGVIGLLGGPLGVLIGGALGSAIGNQTDRTILNQVNRFNQSRL